jgi:hypothetical protein
MTIHARATAVGGQARHVRTAGMLGRIAQPVEEAPWQFLALGDSWGSGEKHCGGSDRSMNKYADFIGESFGHAVEVTNLMERYEPAVPPGTPM